MEGNIGITIRWGRLALFLVVSVIIALVIFNPPYHTNILAKSKIEETDLFNQTNQKRIENGLQILYFNNELYQAAFKKANDIFVRGYFDHYTPDGNPPWQFILDNGYDYEYAGENLAIGFEKPSDATQAWMQSPTHRANILNPRYQDIGIAAVRGIFNNRETTVVVQMFGKERPYVLSTVSGLAQEVFNPQNP